MFKLVKNTIKYIAVIYIYICINNAFANEQNKVVSYQSHSDIISTADRFLHDSINSHSDSISIHVKSLDKRLQLHKCRIPLQAFWPPGAKQIGHTSVGIRCADSKPWKIYVGASIKQYRNVWVSNGAISRGSIITNTHIALAKKEISFIHAEYFDENSSPIGLKAKRPIRKGDIIQVLALEKPMAVSRGDRVIVIARVNGLEIRTAATALDSAAEGERIRVRNIASKKELVGTLHKNSVVHVNI